MRNKYNTNYNHCSDSLCGIKALGVLKTRWNNLFHDLQGNQQKLYCHLNSGEDVLLKCEYTEDSALISVHQPCDFKSIGDYAPELIEPVLAAIHTEYPDADVIGEEKFIRVIIKEQAIDIR